MKDYALGLVYWTAYAVAIVFVMLACAIIQLFVPFAILWNWSKRKLNRVY